VNSRGIRPLRRRQPTRAAATKPTSVEAVRVLIVEDDARFAEILRRNLDGIAGTTLNLRFVTTLAEASRELKAGSFDIILAELNLVGSEGLATLDALHSMGNGIVIVLTGNADNALRDSSLRRGAYHFLNKDEVDRKGLQDVLRLVLLPASTSLSLPIANKAVASEEKKELRESASRFAQRDEELLRFRLAMDRSADIFAIIDRATMRYVDVNTTACAMLGYSREQLLSLGPRDVVVGTRAELEDAYDALIANPAESGTLRADFRCKDGSLLPFESTRHAVQLGGRWFVAAISRDIRGRLATEQALRQREDGLKRFRAALNGSADMMFLIDMADRRLLDFNDTACALLGYERSELILLSPAALMGLSDAQLRENDAALLESPRCADTVMTFRRKDGRTFEVEALRGVIDTPDGRIIVINARDLTDRNLAAEGQSRYVRYQEVIARFGESALGRRDAGELVTDAMQSVVDALRVDAVAYLERGPGERELVVCGLLGATGQEETDPKHYRVGDPVGAALEQGEFVISGGLSPVLPFAWAAELRCSAIVPVRTDQMVQGVLCAFSHVDNAFGAQESKFLLTAGSVLSAGLRRIEGEGRLAFLAQYDSLTGLPNRALLSDRFSLVIALARRHGLPAGVLFIDLDNFKAVNDSLGHAAGDEVLCNTARRLKELLRQGDTVARVSGDEFAVILGTLARPEDAALVAQKIIDKLAAPLQVAGQELFVTASIGIAVFPADGDDPETLLGAADAAMYRAKQSGRNGFHCFTAEINERARAHAQLGSELHRALERNEFELAYQPKFDLTSGRACAAEALLRWKRPDGKLVPPIEFIPVLEESGLIVEVGEWVLRQACADLKAWKAAGLRPIPVAVNLSARQFRQRDLEKHIRQIVENAGVDACLIELEITESQLMHDPEQAERTMRSLSDAGFRVAIDDFGTGYSSLSYLTRFPVSALKIDRSFVANALAVPAQAAIVRAIIDMAHTLGFIVIAEGVETEAQAALLRALGCEQAQGYFFARPMPEADLRAFISNSPLAGPKPR
jgi:diguanylate cyclase (GGDEF)-like protein/PAS domain S-box-containing protein